LRETERETEREREREREREERIFSNKLIRVFKSMGRWEEKVTECRESSCMPLVMWEREYKTGQF
jgi:hypothetical protein